MFLATVSFTSNTASPTNAIVHSLSAPSEPTAVMNGSVALVGSSLACVATARILAIAPPCASTRFFGDEPEHLLVPVDERARISQLVHERRNRLVGRIIVRCHFEHGADGHFLECLTRVDGRFRTDR